MKKVGARKVKPQRESLILAGKLEREDSQDSQEVDKNDLFEEIITQKTTKPLSTVEYF